MAEAGTKHPGRNEPCPCGSGKKYKHCCLEKDAEAERVAREKEANAAPPPAEPQDEAPQRVSPPPRVTEQPWKRTAQRNRGFRRITTPRKAG